MKIIVVLCDQCGKVGGVHHRSAERARSSAPEGWSFKKSVDLCKSCCEVRKLNLGESGKAIRDLCQVVSMRKRGETYDAIGSALGFSRQYAQQLWKAWESEGKKE